MQLAATNVQGIEESVHRLRSDIDKVASNWINDNLAVWNIAEQASLDKANFVNGELKVVLPSGGQATITQAQASQLSKDLRSQANRMEEMGNNIHAALATSPAAGAVAQLQLEPCGPE